MINIFINNIDSGLECAFGRFADATKLSSAGHVLREGSAMQRALEMLEEQAPPCEPQGSAPGLGQSPISVESGG